MVREVGKGQGSQKKRAGGRSFCPPSGSQQAQQEGEGEMRPDLAIMYFEYCLEELLLDEDERACYELAIKVLKRQESVVGEHK